MREKKAFFHWTFEHMQWNLNELSSKYKDFWACAIKRNFYFKWALHCKIDLKRISVRMSSALCTQLLEHVLSKFLLSKFCLYLLWNGFRLREYHVVKRSVVRTVIPSCKFGSIELREMSNIFHQNLSSHYSYWENFNWVPITCWELNNKSKHIDEILDSFLLNIIFEYKTRELIW